MKSSRYQNNFSLLKLIGIAALILMGCDKPPVPEYRIVYYPNKKNIQEEWSIVRTPRGDTLEQGTHKKYNWDGSVSSSVVWKQGKQDGSSQAWYEDGKEKWQKFYKEGKRHGKWRLVYKEGTPWMSINYSEDKLNGKAQSWDRSDSTKVKEAIFNNGNCISGDCTVLDAPVTSQDTSSAIQAEIKKTSETIAAFLE